MATDTAPELRPLLGILYRHSSARLDEVRQAGRKFAHYTTAENALNIIAGLSVWLRNAAVMNDHLEIEHGRAIIGKVLEDQWVSDCGRLSAACTMGSRTRSASISTRTRTAPWRRTS